MFNKKRNKNEKIDNVADLKMEIIRLKDELETSEETIKTLRRGKEDLKHDYERDISDKEKDFQSTEKILRNELGIKVHEAIKITEDENNKLKAEKGALQERVNILEAAFKNMGFDVKDMKGILDQLVKGIVAKNSINVIK